MESDLQPVNIGLFSVWRQASARRMWKRVEQQSHSSPGIALDDDDYDDNNDD